MESCKICSKQSNFLFKAKVLNKYDVSYFKCENCGFIQTENPYWLDEAYSPTRISRDTGYINRSLLNSNIISNFIMKQSVFNPDGKFIDYGGGVGVFVRMMRDKGFDFYLYDKYADNLFAKFFNISELDNECELLTCFEVFEHLSAPLCEIENMLNYSKTIFFSTELQPNKEIASADDWSYFGPIGGQHIAFYTYDTLAFIARKFNLNLYSDGKNIHIFTNRNLGENWLTGDSKTTLKERISKKIIKKLAQPVKMRESFVWKDFEYITSILNEKS